MLARARGPWVLVGALACGCGTELGRVPFSADGAGSTTVTLAAGEVSFWTDLDLYYEGPATMAYDVTLKQGGAAVARVSCDPLARLTTRVAWTEINVDDAHTRRGRGKLGCRATLSAGGPTTIDVELVVPVRPARFELKKADLVVKQ